MHTTEFLKTNGIYIQESSLDANIQLGKNYNFSIETSNDLENWTIKY